MKLINKKNNVFFYRNSNLVFLKRFFIINKNFKYPFLNYNSKFNLLDCKI